MQYKLQRVDDAVVVLLEGKLLSEQETALIKNNIALEISGGQKKFIIDLKGMEFVNSSCLNFLVSTKNLVTEKGGVIVLCNINDQLNRLLEVTKLQSYFVIAGKTSDALSMLQ
ncbi:MAG: STAS domain-containing protein [Chitinophagales bacterium]|nr:STAS domain-containing protein [Chitinophagales bacterium]